MTRYGRAAGKIVQLVPKPSFPNSVWKRTPRNSVSSAQEERRRYSHALRHPRQRIPQFHDLHAGWPCGGGSDGLAVNELPGLGGLAKQSFGECVPKRRLGTSRSFEMPSRPWVRAAFYDE